jgi:hypothetical protein
MNMQRETGLVRFVRGLVGGAIGVRAGESYEQIDGRRASAVIVGELISSGAIDGDELECRSNSATVGWLRRAMLGERAYGDQHRVLARTADGHDLNLAESPLARLASATGGEPPFLERHQVEAGERVRRLAERAQLQPRLTMAYSASQTVGNRSQAAADISDLAADARKSLSEIHRVLPRDCAGVVLDVCGLLKGLQDVERDRRWPRRSAKIVLRIGLEQLAQHFGLAPVAVGKATGRHRNWMDEGARPQRFE